MITPPEVANLALAYLHLDEIVSLDDDNDRARAVRHSWENCRRSFLMEHPWSFAKRSERLARRTDPAPPPWRFGHSCPPDFLSAILLASGARREYAERLDFEIVLAKSGDERIVCSDSEYVILEFVSDRASLSLYSPLAIEALAHRLAFLVGTMLQRDQQAMRQLWEVCRMSLAAAAAKDAENRSYPPIRSNRYNEARLWG